MGSARRLGPFRRRARTDAVCSGGFTLLELLVAMGIFAALGLILIPLLSQGITQWRRGEERREVYERGHLVLETIAQDLGCAFSDAGPRAGGEQHPVEVLMLGDGDATGRPRLRFVRTLKGEAADPSSLDAGAGTPEEGYTEYRTRIGDLDKKLRALRGMAEVAYVMGLDDAHRHVLYRAERAPIGGPESLFAGTPWADQAALETKALPVAENVLLCRFLYWGQYTTSWDEDKTPGSGFGDDGGPHQYWDSTRGILPVAPRRRTRAPLSGYFDLAVGPESRDDPVDDIYPAMVRIQVVLGTFGPNVPAGTLIGDIGEKDKRCTADNRNFPTEPATGFRIMVLNIDDEWIEYNRVDSSGFRFGERGLFGTRPAKHADGAAIRTGIMFSRAVPIPARRNYWNK